MVLHSKHKGPTPPPGEFRQLIFDSIRKHKNDVFMIDGLTDEKLTYGELFQKAVSVAIFLNGAGVGNNDKVVLLTDVTLTANVFAIGVWLAGATMCSGNAALTPEEIRQLIDLCEPKLVYCQGKYLGTLEAALPTDDEKIPVVTDVPHSTYVNVNDKLDANTSEFKMGTYDPEESITHMIFTSGTTGVPKGVLCTSRSVKAAAYKLPLNSLAFLCTSPIYWVSYTMFVLGAALYGTTVIVPRTKYFPGTNDVDLTHILHCIQKYKPNSWFTSPSVLMDLCNNPSRSSYDLSSMKRVTIGGSQLLASQRRQICDELFGGRKVAFIGYGASEFGGITYWPESEAPDYDSPQASSLGMLAPGFSLKVLDVDTGAELGPGQTGELVLKSDSIMKGYHKHPETYTPDDWFRMGDLGYYDEEGYLYFVGRLKEIMKYRGLQIAPPELEKVILQHPQVQEVCVVGRPHPIDGERPAAFIVRKTDSLTEEDIHNFVNERVADPKKLRGGVFFLDSIPKNAIGKIVRRDLVKLFDGMKMTNGGGEFESHTIVVERLR